MGDQQNARNVTGQAIDILRKASWQLATGLYIYVPRCCLVAFGALTCGTVICYVLWRIYIWLKRNYARWVIIPITIAIYTYGAVVCLPRWSRVKLTDCFFFGLWCLGHIYRPTNILRKHIREVLFKYIPGTVAEEDLMAIPRPEENIQRTFVGVLSSETADKLKAMFRKNFCPDIVPLNWGHKLPPECRLVICCLPKNIRRMYLDGDTNCAKLITDAGSLEAMVLIIIFGERDPPGEALFDKSIYGSVFQQGQNLYSKGWSKASLLDKGFQDNKAKKRGDQSRNGLPENIALVTVDNRPSRFQLRLMKKFVECAFAGTT